MKMCVRSSAKQRKRILVVTTLVVTCVISSGAQAQTGDGNAGINQATTMVKGYFNSGADLMYAIGAIVGLAGAIKVFNKWNSGHPDVGSTAAAWFGSCVFLVVVATVLKSFFGI